MTADDPRRHAPAAARNAASILAILRGLLPPKGTVLETASGSGEHVVRFAREFPALNWQPSDPSAEARASIAAWVQGCANVRPPLALDAAAPAWPSTQADAILCINMIHISPWSATEGLMQGAARLLAPGAPLYLYGPFIVPDTAMAPSNLAFDASLRERNPAWGLRDLDAVTTCAHAHGLHREYVITMPANNLSVIFRRGAA